MEGLGVNGLVIGSSEKPPGQTRVKEGSSRTWASFIECISATGKVLDPLIIFKGASVQDQWFSGQLLENILIGILPTLSMNGQATIVRLSGLRKLFATGSLRGPLCSKTTYCRRP